MSKKTDQIKFMQAMFPNAKFVECKYIEEGQRIADDSKTITVEKEVYEAVLKNSIRATDLEIKLIPFTDPYFKGLTTKDIAELAKKSIRLTTQHCKDNKEIEILKEYEAHNTHVPTYEEYLESESHCAVYIEVNKLLEKKNQKLKSLLKDLRKLIGNNFLNNEMRILLNEIDKVLK